MAWISVHEQILGGKLRSLAKTLNCSQNEVIGLLVRLWLWGIHNADKDGLIICATVDDVEDILSIGISKEITAEEALKAMIETGWVEHDNAGLRIHDWEEWQKQWYKAMGVREKDRERKREQKQRVTSEETPEQLPNQKPDSKGAIDSGVSTPPTEPRKKLETDYSTEFEEFWTEYPRKLGKGDAYRCYKARLNDGWRPEDLVAAAKNYAYRVHKDKTEPKYIKHPKTFLSASTPFTDFIRKKDKETRMTVDDDNPYEDW